MKNVRLAAVGLLALILLLGPACSGDRSGSPSSIVTPGPSLEIVDGGGEDALLAVAVHDAPDPEIREAWVTFAGVAAHVAGAGWIDLPRKGPVEVDLLTLVNGRAILLAEATVPSAKYDALRLDIAAARIVGAEGDRHEVSLPEGGVRLEHSVDFVCAAGEPAVVSLDFRVESSFRRLKSGVAFSPDVWTDSVRVVR